MSRRLCLGLLALLALVALLGLPLVGPRAIALDALFRPGAGDPAAVILWQIRLPRVLAALVGGAGLALAGTALQALFRNPLATPYTLGVASGATFGVALATRLAPVLVAGLGGSPLGAIAGALVATVVVWALSRVGPALSGTVLLLAGVAMSFFFSSLTLLMQYTATLGDSFRIVRWMMGGLGGVDVAGVRLMLPFVVVGGAVIAWRVRELDLLSVGADLAASRGVAVERVRAGLFFATSLVVAGVVAVCGPIAFVGMMAPHICRLLVGAEHRRLLPASLLFGGAFLALCDTAARTVVAPLELPVGVITAFLGGPFFLWLLLRRGVLTTLD